MEESIPVFLKVEQLNKKEEKKQKNLTHHQTDGKMHQLLVMSIAQHFQQT